MSAKPAIFDRIKKFNLIWQEHQELEGFSLEIIREKEKES